MTNDLNCWEFNDCGRQSEGRNVDKYGVCPATLNEKANGFLGGVNGGRSCLFITGTFCSTSVKGKKMEKTDKDCVKCDFYKVMKYLYGPQLSLGSFVNYIKSRSN